MTHTFDQSKYKTASDVAYALATTEMRMRDRRRQADELLRENVEDEHRITQLDRWMLAIFEANPHHRAVKLSVQYRDVILTPGNGIVDIHVPEYVAVLNMAPYPVEDDLMDVEHDEIDPEDDDALLTFAQINADMLGRNGHHHVVSDQASS